MNCDFSSTTKFTYDAHEALTPASNYIKGLDCSAASAEVKYFPKFFIQYKRTVKDSSPSAAEYMASEKTTIWTLYPERN